MIKKSSIWTNIILFGIVCASFLLYSSVFYPLLNSDDAVLILMLDSFRIPEDIYFWGQNRVGSIIPLLGQIPLKLFGINLLWSESLIHYLVLILGFAAFSTFLKSKISKVVFAIVWFIPTDPFLGLVRYSFGLHYSFIAIGLYLIKYYTEHKVIKNIWKYLLWILTFISFLTAVWITETAIVTIGIVLFVLLIRHLTSHIKIAYDSIVFTIVSIVLGVLIIYVLKNVITIYEIGEYDQQLLNTPSQFISAVSVLFSKIIKSFTFQSRNPFLVIYNYLCLIQIILVPLLIVMRKTKRIHNWQWIAIFILDGLSFLFINVISHWSLLNGVARRYFVGIYIVFWLAYLIFTEHISNKRITVAIHIVALITVIIGAASIPYGYKYVYPKRLTPKAQVVSEFKTLGKIGIISDYWNSYGTSFVDPKNIKATPHDKCEIRNHDLVDSVFAQPKIFLIRDMWLDSFPCIISQFGKELYRVGDEFRMGDCNVCEYELYRFDTTLYVSDLKHSLYCPLLEDGLILTAQKNNDNIIYTHIISGPYITLSPGDYVVSFHILTNNGDEAKSVGVIDVVADFGQNTLASKKIMANINSLSKSDSDAQLSFSLSAITKNVEFRIYYYGEADLLFSHIDIKQTK